MKEKKFKKALGARVKALRKEGDWFQLDFAQEIGLHENTIQKLERGIENLRLNSLLSISIVLGKKPSELLAEAGY